MAGLSAPLVGGRLDQLIGVDLGTSGLVQSALTAVLAHAPYAE